MHYSPTKRCTYLRVDILQFSRSQTQTQLHFEKVGNQTKVKQIMQYEMKFGVFGKIMDALMVRNQSDKGIKKFFAGLKSFTEMNKVSWRTTKN